MQVAELLSRMALAGEVAGDGSVVRVSVPPTRSDVLHPCDVAEVHRTASLLPPVRSGLQACTRLGPPSTAAPAHGHYQAISRLGLVHYKTPFWLTCWHRVCRMWPLHMGTTILRGQYLRQSLSAVSCR
jgi:tRNA synthetase B5 domain